MIAPRDFTNTSHQDDASNNGGYAEDGRNDHHYLYGYKSIGNDCCCGCFGADGVPWAIHSAGNADLTTAVCNDRCNCATGA